MKHSNNYGKETKTDMKTADGDHVELGRFATLAKRIRDHIDRLPTTGPLARADARLWRRVECLEDVGELTARWLEGDIGTCPGYYGRPDEETEELIPTLAALNRSGFVTIGSQPGKGPTRGAWEEPEMRWWWQRAAVDGLAQPEIADRIQEASAASGLLVVRHERAGWRSSWDDAVTVTASGPDETPEPGFQAVEHTSFGTHLSRRDLSTCLGDASGYAGDVPQVTVIDPQWCRNSLLWPVLTEELVQERELVLDPGSMSDARELIEIDHREPELALVETDERELDGQQTLDAAVEEPQQYLGYVDGELVRDERSGAVGHVRVRDDEEIGRYAEVAWGGSFVSDQLEVAIDNGLQREGDVLEAELVNDEPELVAASDDAALITAARYWISDCTWADLASEDVAELSDEDVLRGIDTHYDGGVRAFAEDGCLDAEQPLPFLVDEDGFPTEHVTFQGHTLPDDTYSWVCGKSGCYNGLVEHDTREESLAAAEEHETQHGYVRECVLDDAESMAEPDPDPAELELVESDLPPVLEAEPVGPQLTDDELIGEPELALAEPDLTVDESSAQEATDGTITLDEVVEPELAADEQELTGPDSDDELDGDAEQVMEPEVELTEPSVADPEVEVAEPDQWETDTPESAPTSWWGTSKQWVNDRAGDVTSWASDRAAKAKLWVDELRSGRHRQSFGQWEQTGMFGCTKECTVQVGKNVLGMDLEEMNATFGAGFIGRTVVRNDRERRSFEEQADFIERTQLEGREPELER